MQRRGLEEHRRFRELCCVLNVLYMPENEYRFVCSVCSRYVGLYGVFTAIRRWSCGYEGIGKG